jgi:hypothetical protein
MRDLAATQPGRRACEPRVGDAGFLLRWHRLGLIAELSMLCGKLANILTSAADGSDRGPIGAESMFAKCGKHTLGWQTYSGDAGEACGMVRGVSPPLGLLRCRIAHGDIGF